MQSKQELFEKTTGLLKEVLYMNLTIIEQRELRFITDNVFERGTIISSELKEKIRNDLPYDLLDTFNWQVESATLFLHDYYSIPIRYAFDVLHGIDKEAISEYVKRQQEREHHFL